MREIAAFASSEAGKTFARVEQHFGRDPAACLQEDDVLAHNLRAALIVTMAQENKTEPEPLKLAERG